MKMLPYWPLLIISILMIVAAVIDGWKLKVPNWLTFPMIVSGWLLAVAYGLGMAPAPGTPEIETGWERILGSLYLTLIAMLLLGIVWVLGMMGAGDVKMQMGFGSWIGAFFGKDQGWQVFWPGFVIGLLVGGVLALGLMVYHRSAGGGATNLRNVLLDFMYSGSLSEIQDRGKERKKHQILLPYGIPLCIGFVGYLIYYVATYLS